MFLFILIAYLWSYSIWLLGIKLATSKDSNLLLNENLIMNLLQNNFTQTEVWLSLLVIFAVYGPLIGFAIICLLNRNYFSWFKKRFQLTFPLRYLWQILFILLSVSILPILVVFMFTDYLQLGTETNVYILICFFFIFLVYQFFTSATEEVGWRGFLLPYFLKKHTLWNASVIVGLIWSFWHLPIVFYIFFQSGHTWFSAFFSFVGFTFGIIAMSALHAYYYIKTKNVYFSMLIHTLFNTFPLTLGLLFANAFLTAVAAQIMLWVVIGILNFKNNKIFDQYFYEDALSGKTK